MMFFSHEKRTRFLPIRQYILAFLKKDPYTFSAHFRAIPGALCMSRQPSQAIGVVVSLLLGGATYFALALPAAKEVYLVREGDNLANIVERYGPSVRTMNAQTLSDWERSCHKERGVSHQCRDYVLIGGKLDVIPQ